MDEERQEKQVETSPVLALLYELNKTHKLNNIFHWIFHIICIAVITFMIWSFLQYDTYDYTQDSSGTNTIKQVINGGEIDGTKDENTN